MERPHVVLHNAVSLDGRVDGFAVDLARFYGLAATFREDASLAGSLTLADPSQPIPPETAEDLAPPPPPGPRDRRPLLVVPDSRGRVRNWHVLRRAGHWRDFVSLCTRATPKRHLDYLRRRGVHVLVIGTDRVDLPRALATLRERFSVRRVRVDSGGTLNGVLLRLGVVDEVSLLIHPVLVGGDAPRSIFRAPGLADPSSAAVALRLTSQRRLPGGIVWLRYRVRSAGRQGSAA